MTEQELFAAYRHRAGYSAQCACGTWIDAPSTATEQQIGGVVNDHNASEEHAQWSLEQEAVAMLRRVPVRVCPCHGVEA
jgi:hypothetical protein